MSKISSPRDPASGLPTGKRMHKPITMAADPAPGLPTGKRNHLPVATKVADEFEAAKAPRDSVSGNATGRRQYKAVE